MHQFPGIETCLKKGALLEVSSVGKPNTSERFWVAQLMRSDGRLVGPQAREQLHLMLSIITLEQELMRSLRPSFRRKRHEDSTALILLRQMEVSITVRSRDDGFAAHIYEKQRRVPGVTIESNAAVSALLESVSLAFSAIAAAHQAKYLGH